MFNLQFLLTFVILVIVVCIVCGVLTWIVRSAPMIPNEWKPTVTWLIMVFGVLIILFVLIGALTGSPIVAGWYRHNN